MAQARRIEALREDAKATFHAFSVSSAYEKGVIEAIASIGSGSVRAVGDDPGRAASAFLAEIAQPAVRDLEVEFDGVRTARVYPERLPNLPAGRQQVVLGRFLPSGGAQKGSVVVTGTRDGKPVRFTAPFEIQEGETGNSFLPRLWARLHVEALLREGRSASVKEDIVAFSEEYGIITPYTSFLVLESDEDRRRYGVDRRVAMRDGERFFAEAKDRASTEILRQQMQKARTYRLKLRRRMLREIARLGRDLAVRGAGWGDVGGFKEAEYLGHGQSEKRRAFEEPVIRDGKVADRSSEGEELTDEEYDAETPDDAPPAAPPPEEPAPEMARDSLLEEAGESQRVDFDSYGARLEAESLREVSRPRGGSARYWRPYSALFTGHFPMVPAAPEAAPAERPDWPEEVIALLASLDRRAPLASLDGGVALVTLQIGLHPLRGDRTSLARSHGVYSSRGWFLAQWGRSRLPHHQWAFEGTRGSLAAARRLGRKRPAAEADLTAFTGLPAFDGYVRNYAKYSASAVTREAGIVTVRLSAPEPQDHETVLLVDETRKVVLEERQIRAGKVTWTAKYSDFVEAGGLWWARRTASLDAEGRVVHRGEWTVTELTAEAAASAIREAISDHGDVLFLGPTAPQPEAAKQAAHDRKATWADHLVIAQEHAAYQRWDEALESFEAFAGLAAGKPGVDWLRAAVLSVARRGEAFESHVRRLAASVAERKDHAGEFLAWHLYETAIRAFQGNELLRLAVALEGAGGAEDAEWRAHSWRRRRAGLLDRLGRTEEARAEWKRLATDRPEDPEAFLGHLNAVTRTGELEAAAALALEVVGQEKPWTPSETVRVFRQVTDLLWNAHRFEDLLRVAEVWIDRSPSSEEGYERFLVALLILDRVEEYDAWVGARFEEDAGDDPVRRARLGAAINMCLRRAWRSVHHRNQVDEKWERPLVSLARRLARKDATLDLANRIASDWRLRQRDSGRALREGLCEDLLAPGAIDQMSVRRLTSYLGWIPWARGHRDEATWRRVTDLVASRYEKAVSKEERRALAWELLKLLDARAADVEAIAFLEKRLESADDRERSQVASQLLERLLRTAWTEPMEERLFRLLPLLPGPGAKESGRRALFMSTVRRLADRLLAKRIEATLGPAEEREKLPRAELRRRQRVARTEARKGLVARFRSEQEAAPEEARPFLEIERLCFAVELGEDLRATEAEARELLLSSAAPSEDAPSRVLRQRASLVLAHAAVQSKAPEGLRERVLELYRDRLAEEPEALDWRYEIYRLLVALDRPVEIEAALRTWIEPAKVESRWRIALAYLLAETGRVEDAAAQLEAVAALDELAAAGYAVLADWYLVLGDGNRRERAIEKRYEVTSEGRLARLLYGEVRRLGRRDSANVPADLDPEVLRVIRAILGKATYPANYEGNIRRLYRAVKDFRLLAGLADGVLGHTPQGIYPFLVQTSRTISEVHEEATCDEIAAAIAGRFPDARTDTDRRALRLLLAAVERRAANVLNEPGPHVAKALDAMRAAFPGSWLPGERRLMASFLASLGKIPREPLATEQLRQLTELHRLEETGTEDRLRIAQFLGRTLWQYDRHDDALDLVAAALEEHREASGGRLPLGAHDVVEDLIGWLESLGRFRRAESLLLAEIARQPQVTREWFHLRLLRLYVNERASRRRSAPLPPPVPAKSRGPWSSS
ncbi:MAG: hypothetical protein ACYTDY_06665 [Planctomycetota bacterium]